MQLTLLPSSLTKKPLRRLNCSPSFLRSISGLAPRESEQLLNMLWEHATRPEFVYRHKWQTGDVVFCPSPTSSRSPQGCSWLSLGLVRRQGTTAEHCTSGRRTSPKPRARSSARCTASPPAASLSEASTESPPARSVRRVLFRCYLYDCARYPSKSLLTRRFCCTQRVRPFWALTRSSREGSGRGMAWPRWMIGWRRFTPTHRARSSERECSAANECLVTTDQRLHS